MQSSVATSMTKNTDRKRRLFNFRKATEVVEEGILFNGIPTWRSVL